MAKHKHMLARDRHILFFLGLDFEASAGLPGWLDSCDSIISQVLTIAGVFGPPLATNWS